MRIIFALLLSTLLASAAWSAQQPYYNQQPSWSSSPSTTNRAVNSLPLQLLPGQSYIYAYTGRLVSGIVSADQNAAVLEIKSDIVLQPDDSGSNIAMQMTNIRVGKHNGAMSAHLAHGNIVIEHQENKQYEQHLNKPIRFHWANGQVKQFEASSDEPEWSINVKKAILSLLNINLNPQKIIRANGAGGAKENSIFGVRDQQSSYDHQPLVVYPIYEDSIGGICETVYEVKHSPYGWKSPEQWQKIKRSGATEQELVLNVTKTRNYANCLTQPILEKTNMDVVRGAPVGSGGSDSNGKPYPIVDGYYPMSNEQQQQQSAAGSGQEQYSNAGQQQGQGQQHQTPVEQFEFVKYNISKVLESGYTLVESVYGEGKSILNTNGQQIVMITQQNFTLELTASTAEIGQIKSVKQATVHQELSFRLPKPVGDNTKLDIPYYHLFGKIDRQELVTLIPEMLNSIAEDIVSNDVVENKKTMQKTVQLNNAFSVLDTAQLEEVFVKIATAGRSIRATAQEQIVRKLFLDLLGSTGTTQTALLAKKLYETNQLTTGEAKELFEAVPQNLFLAGDLKVVEAYLNLFLSPKVQSQRHLASSVGIAFGKMLHEAVAKRTQMSGDIQSWETEQKQRRAQELVANNANVYYQPAYQQRQQPQQPQPQQQYQPQPQRIRRSAPWSAQFRQELIEKEQITEVLNVLRAALRDAKTFHAKVTMIETLAHTGLPQVLEILAPYINDRASAQELPGYLVEQPEQQAEERNFIRQVTIYALAHIAPQYPQQVLALLLPVYENVAEPYEVRIAAFTIMMHSNPSKLILERIASELYEEQNRQVKSFVVSTLETIANFTQPEWQTVATAARSVVQLAPKDKLGLHYSKMIGGDYYDEQKQFGLNYLLEWVASNVSQVPRSAYFALGQSNGPLKSTLIELGYNAKGMDSLVKRLLLQPSGIVSDALETMNTQTKDRRIFRARRAPVDTSASEALESLKQKLNFATRGDAEPKATIFFKLFERTSYFALDRHYLHQIIDQAEDRVKDLTSQLMAGKSYHYVKLFLPNQLYKVVPSALGLPVVITQRYPTIVSVKISKAKLQLEMPGKSALLPIGANFTVKATPTILHSAYNFVYAVSPATEEAIGTHVEKSTRATIPVELSVGYKRNHQLNWSIVPTVPQEVLHQHTKAKTFISRTSIASSVDRDWLQESQTIKTQHTPLRYERQFGKKQFGIGLRMQMETENVFGEEQIMPPTAPLMKLWRTLLSTIQQQPQAQQHNNAGGNYNHQYGQRSSSKVLSTLIETLDATTGGGAVTPQEFSVQLESDPIKQVSGFDFSLRYKKIEDLFRGATSGENKRDSTEQQQNPNDELTEEETEQEWEDDQEWISADAAQKANRRTRGNSAGYHRQAWIWAARAAAKSFYNTTSSSANKELLSTSVLTTPTGSPSIELVWQQLYGSKYAPKSIKMIARKLVQQTKPVWASEWTTTTGAGAAVNIEELQKRHQGVFEYDQSKESQKDAEATKMMPAIVSHDVILTAVARSTRPTYYGANVLVVKSFDEQKFWLKVNAFARHEVIEDNAEQSYVQEQQQQKQQELCFDSVVVYPTLPDEFHYEPTATQNMKAKFAARVALGADQCRGRGNGAEINTKKSSSPLILINGLMEKVQLPETWYQMNSDDSSDRSGSWMNSARNDADSSTSGSSNSNTESDASQKSNVWFYKQCAVDRAQGKPLSYACERAIIEDTYFQQFVAHVQYHNIAPEMKNFTRKLALATKVAWYDHMSEWIERSDAQVAARQSGAQRNTVRVKAQFFTQFVDLPLVNLEVDTPKEVMRFTKMHIPAIRPISALLPISQVYENVIAGYDAADKCVLMENFVRTFDNVTVRMSNDQMSASSMCQFLLAKDCSPSERFAIFARHLDAETKTKEITVMIGGTEIRLLPPAKSGNQAQVIVDGRTVELQAGAEQRPKLLSKNGGDIVVYLRAPRSPVTEPIVVIKSSPTTELTIKYDGKNVKIELGKQYQGKMCGLCGDNNDESINEYTGPDQCVYQREEDFVRSYALSGEHCEQAPIPSGPKRCPVNVMEQDSGSVSDQYNSNENFRNSGNSIAKQYIQLRKSKKQRSDTMQAMANAEEMAMINQNQMEQMMARQPSSSMMMMKQNAQQQPQPQQYPSGYGQQPAQQQPQQPMMMMMPSMPMMAAATPQQQRLAQRLRTYYMHHQGQICFSTTPVLACIDGVSRPVSMQQQLTPFHCLPAQSISAQRLTTQANTQVLEQFARKPVHTSQYINVPVGCIAA